MNFDIAIDEDEGIITVGVSCVLDQDVRKKILLAVAKQLGMSTFSRVLIDLTESNFDRNEPMTGALELTNFMRFIGIKPHVRFAFVYSEAEGHRKYFEDVAQLDGFNLRYFRSRNEALEWLRQEGG